MLKILKGNYVKFVVGGVSLFIFEYIFTIFLTEVIGIKSHISYMFALLFGILFLFYYHLKITFKAKGQKKKIFLKFIVGSIFSYILNAYFVYLLTQKMLYFFAIPLTASILSVMFYFAYKKVVFI